MTYRLTEKKARFGYKPDTRGILINETEKKYAPITYGQFIRYGDKARANGFSVTYWFGMQDGPETETCLFTDEFTTMKIKKGRRMVSEIDFYIVEKYNVNTEKYVYVRPTKVNGRYFKENMKGYRLKHLD